jgi:hypothetical protein
MEISRDHKTLLFVRASGARKKRVVEYLRSTAPELLNALGSANASVTVLSSLAVDPFRLLNRTPGYQITVELRTDAGPDALSAAARSVVGQMPENVDPSKHCAIVVGHDYTFRRCTPQPLRFQYLMHRREDFTHDAYSKRYAEVHSEFGLKTRGTEGYVQCHMDPEASKELAEATGCGRYDFDSVAQLDLKSLSRFALVAPYNATLGGIEDEKHFINRAASYMFVSKVVTRLHG